MATSSPVVPSTRPTSVTCGPGRQASDDTMHWSSGWVSTAEPAAGRSRARRPGCALGLGDLGRRERREDAGDRQLDHPETTSPPVATATPPPVAITALAATAMSTGRRRTRRGCGCRGRRWWRPRRSSRPSRRAARRAGVGGRSAVAVDRDLEQVPGGHLAMPSRTSTVVSSHSVISRVDDHPHAVGAVGRVGRRSTKSSGATALELHGVERRDRSGPRRPATSISPRWRRGAPSVKTSSTATSLEVGRARRGRPGARRRRRRGRCAAGGTRRGRWRSGRRQDRVHPVRDEPPQQVVDAAVGRAG